MDGIREDIIGSQFLEHDWPSLDGSGDHSERSSSRLGVGRAGGEHGAVMDVDAVMRMVRIDDRASVPAVDAPDADQDLTRSAT